jgi:hypothetical protein
MSPRNESDDIDGAIDVGPQKNMDVQEDPPQMKDMRHERTDQNRNNGGKPRTSKKARLFDESGLSDSQRREIRQNQRHIQQTLRDGDYATFDDIEHVRNRNNEVFQTSVCFTREGK